MRKYKKIDCPYKVGEEVLYTETGTICQITKILGRRRLIEANVNGSGFLRTSHRDVWYFEIFPVEYEYGKCKRRVEDDEIIVANDTARELFGG